MKGKALGMIETVGLVPAVEAGDVAVKTADVSILGSEAVGGGLVSVLMTGDVAAVKASVDAGSTAAARLGEVHSVTVIARTAEGLEEVLVREGARPKSAPGGNPDAGPMGGAACDTVQASLPGPFLKSGDGRTDGGEPVAPDMDDLKKKKVTALRRIARGISGFPMARSEIKYARKKDLLEAFVQYITTSES
ncbi:BMC domain-containing protein [Desulfoluna butyratoxydans]|uniref:Microcompartment protein bacteria n=1 Tax=Desulfoluna butyratoxydans TaxID=231438 RepID=A0A4U8YM49_9BACT|nr:BMC domain-containing protein [Desulfoluna butyratoxydans]VFQ45086.1 microcompartment protein bacteria [Desulfoluna butyratoxydans]